MISIASLEALDVKPYSPPRYVVSLGCKYIRAFMLTFVRYLLTVDY